MGKLFLSPPLIKKDYKVYFKKLSEASFSSPYEKDKLTLNHFDPHLTNEEFYQKLGNADRFYAYLFWHRRYLEGNMEEVYKILQEIKAHYQA